MKFLAALFILIAVCPKVYSQQENIEVLEFVVRKPPPGLKITAAYGLIKNNSPKDLFLVSIDSTWGQIEIHQTKMVAGMMEMNAIKRLKIPSHSQVRFKSGSLHLMIKDISIDLEEGNTASLLFRFLGGKSIPVTATIKKP